jgi:Uma2 family endonuclease
MSQYAPPLQKEWTQDEWLSLPEGPPYYELEEGRFTKLEGYKHAGVRFYWVIDPETLLVAEYELTPEGYVLRSHVEGGAVFRPRLFEGLELKLAEMFGS